jgi:hypothetical protein
MNMNKKEPLEIEFDCSNNIACVCGKTPTRRVRHLSYIALVHGSAVPEMYNSYFCRECSSEFISSCTDNHRDVTLTFGPNYSLTTLNPQ